LCYLKGIVQLESLLRTEERTANGFLEIPERIADVAVDETDANPIFGTTCKRGIDARTGGDLHIFPRYVAWAIVKTERQTRPQFDLSPGS